MVVRETGDALMRTPRLAAHAALAVLAALAMSSPLPATARIRPNPEARLVLDPAVPRGAAPLAAAPLGSATTSVLPEPLPAGAEAVDSTWYDLQDMGSLGHHIEVGPDGRVHVTWQDEFCELGGGCPPNLAAPQPHPNRGMGYAVRSAAGAWTNFGKVRDARLPECCVRDLVGGFGSLALPSSGRVAIAQHLNEDGCDLRGYFHLQDAVGSNLFRGYLTPVTSPSNLFPQVAASTNGSFTVVGEVPRGGLYDETTDIRVSYLPAPGTIYTCFNWQMGNWLPVFPVSLFRDGRGAFPCIAAGSDGRVGIAVTDFGGNVFLAESPDGSFAPATLRIRTLTAYTDAQITATDSTSSQYRPWIHCHLAYNDTTPHVVWSELQARKSGTTVAYFDHRSRIRHWSSVRGLETVYQVPAGLADRYDDVDQGLAGPLPGFNTISVDWPQVGFSSDGFETYVAFLRFSDADVDPTADMGLPGIVTGIGFGEIAASATHGAAPWSAPQNLTQTPRTDERFFSLSTRNPGGRAHLVFQASATDQAGSAIIGDRGTTPGNLLRRIAYLARPLTASVLDAPAAGAALAAPLEVSPNPVFGAARARFSAGAWAAGRSIGVYDLNGRRVARLAFANARPSAEWDGRTPDGRPAPAGVYFARMDDAPELRPARFVLAR